VTQAQIPLIEPEEVVLPYSQETGTYTDSDLKRAGWQVMSHCTAPAMSLAVELPSESLQLPEDRFSDLFEVIGSGRSEALIQESLKQLVNCRVATDLPTEADVARRRGRFAR
jgi:hypothetical protein